MECWVGLFLHVKSIIVGWGKTSEQKTQKEQIIRKRLENWTISKSEFDGIIKKPHSGTDLQCD